MAEVPGINSLTKEQKTGFVLLLVFALLTIALGVLQMRNTIYNPFVLKNDRKNAPTKVVVDETAKLQAIDTDQDGLNNYEELFFYETSPYLPDTDSDGAKDREEITAGKDPNCPEGKICATAAEVGVTTTPSLITSPLGANTGDPLGILNEAGFVQGEGAQASPEIQQYLNDPAKLRELLQQSGELTDAQIFQIDDATLLEIAKSIVAGNTSQPIEPSSASVTSSQP